MEPSIPEARSASILSLANLLSATRLLLAPLCGWLILDGQSAQALAVYGLAVATDLIDGPVARHRNQATSFGALLDHGSDALFVTLGLGAFASLGLVPMILPPLIALAFTQYTLDSRALSGAPLRASGLGRCNGIAYFVLLATPLVRTTVGLDWPGDSLVRVLGWGLVGSTVISMGDRLLALQRSIKA